MKRLTAAMMVLAALGGPAATGARAGNYMSHAFAKDNPADNLHWGVQGEPNAVPGMVGPWGQPVSMAAPYNLSPPSGESAARAMLAQSVPLDLLQQANSQNGQGAGLMQAAGACGPGGCPPGMPPGGLVAPPGMGPLPGMAPTPAMGVGPPGAVAAVGALTGGGPGPFPVQRTEVRFVGPAGMKISWYAPRPDGRPGFGSQYLEAPARYNFLQASVYRLKLSDIPNRSGVELYPTLEVVPGNGKTCTFLAHSAVPVNFTEEDFEQIAAGNFVTKVIYLPYPQFQDLAATGPDEVVSSRLEPGVDPIAEAQRRGSILAIIRLGNIDLEAPNTPAMDAPSPFRPQAPCPPGVQVPALPPGLAGRMVPYGALGGQPPVPGAPNGPPVGQALPPVPGSTPPVSTSTPPGAPTAGPGTPLGQLPPTSSVQPAQSRTAAGPRTPSAGPASQGFWSGLTPQH